LTASREDRDHFGVHERLTTSERYLARRQLFGDNFVQECDHLSLGQINERIIFG
jgi:hypothetical protein